MSDHTEVFTKGNLDSYLYALAKEYRRLVGKSMPAEIVLIGGAAIVANYGFRDMTTDVDALIQAASAMKDAINHVGDAYGLPTGWLNADFKMTESYSPKIAQYSKYYKQFSQVLTVRTVSAEYLVAMKLRAGRQYKNDLSDVIGILAEHEARGTPLTREQIVTAAENLYESYDNIPVYSRDFLEKALASDSLQEVYRSVSEEEKLSKSTLIQFEKDYPGVTNKENAADILRNLKQRKKAEE